MISKAAMPATRTDPPSTSAIASMLPTNPSASTNFSNTPTGMTKPNNSGIQQTRIHAIWPRASRYNGRSACVARAVLAKRWRERAYSSSPSRLRINTNPTSDICAAATMLFIPSHTLKIPSVSVSTAKYSTVPKSDTTSISTSASPAVIAGRASGRPTAQNCDLR